MARPRKHDPADVLQSAMEVFWRKGFVATSMSDIYEATGLKPGNLYATYHDKDGIFRAAFQAYVAHFRASLPDGLVGLSAVEAWLRTQVRLALEDPERRGCLIVNTAAERQAHSPETRALAEARLEEIRSFFLQHLGVACRAGDMEPGADVPALADGLLGAVVAIMSLARSGMPDRVIRNVGDQALQRIRRRSPLESPS